MPNISVAPGIPDPSHDISLSDGSTTYGFTLAGGTRAFQEIPLSPPASSFEINQRGWVGGRGVVNVSDDNTAYFDSQNLWASSEGKMFPSMRAQFATLRTDVDSIEMGESTTFVWQGLYTTTRYIADSFIAGNSVAQDKAYVNIRRIGSPGSLVLELCADHATPGKPGTVLQTVTMTAATVPDLVSVYKVFDWASTNARSASTVYWIKLYAASADTSTDHWEVLTSGTTGGLGSSDNSTWGTTLGAIGLRVVGADTARKWFFFELYGAMYAVSKLDSRGTSTMIMNGFRGTAASGGATTLVCSQTCSRDYTGAFIRIIDGTGDGQVRQISSNTTGGSVTFTVPTWDVNPDSTSIFVVYGTQFWDAVTGTTGLGYVTGQPIVSNKICYIPQGTAVAVRRMRVNGNSHDFAAEATVKGDMLYVNTDSSTGSQIWVANIANSTVSNCDVAAWGTELVVLTTTVIGFTSTRITNMFNYQGTFYIFKEDGLYAFDGTRVARFGRNFSDIADANNGAAVSNDNTYLWWTWGHSVERMLGKNITDMLNWRGGFEGLPDNRRGVITTIVSAIGWMFFVVDGGASNYSSIIYWNGYGWHELYRAPETGVRIRTAVWQSCPETNPRLWIDVNGELMFIKFPKNTSVPVKDTSMSYNYEGVLITPTIDAGSIETYKIIKSVRVFQNGTAQPVYVDYQINGNVDTANWTYLGLADAAPFEEITMNVGGITQVRFRFRIYSNTYATPGVVTGLSISGREMPLTKYQYIGNYTASTDMDTKLGEPDTSSETTYAQLQTWAINQTKLTLRTLSTSSDNKSVSVSLPVKEVDWQDQDQWGGRIRFSLLQT